MNHCHFTLILTSTKMAKKKPDHTDAVLIKRMDEPQDADRMKTILTPG